ncbi:MFS transporter [Mucilaginibacter pallidiroseus]|uniref:MFS transporter n=1 Tax=Mucilaginibacter pallidiroseus TaxID=2599295 RepID=A0A563TXS8_9SPHI|nr:MFS transporter [Mucilaginibacter pallidiroseus]TWR24063.1 MFS transporter [Mucilaginibacter pallidiroseus]
MEPSKPVSFTGYQKFVIAILALTQFTVILDFMIMSPLGDMMMRSLSLQPKDFGVAVSAYAFSAGLSGLLTAGFADKFDRKKLFIFFYTGFIIGTIFCGLAHNYVALVTARIITGLFGGVIGSISMAIITDLFALQQRGRVIGFVQMGLGGSQVLGVPIGLYLANHWGWEAPFWLTAGLAVVVALLILIKLQPVTQHLSLQKKQPALAHLWSTIAKKNYRVGFTATALLSIGGFMMMPFGSAFGINNLKLTNEQLPMLFMVSGVASLTIMPLVGKLSDRFDKFKLFAIACIWMIAVCITYTHRSVTPLWIAMIFNVCMTLGIMSRMIPSSALISAIPEMADRGAFMSVNASMQQIAGGIAAAVAGMIVVQNGEGQPLQNYDIIGYLVSIITLISIGLLWRVNNLTKKKMESPRAPVIPEEALAAH